MSKKRSATISRKTKETSIKINLVVDGTGKTKIKTGLAFFDHMLTLLGKHALFNLEVLAKGDIEVDEHHTVEDVGICLGEALKSALKDKKGIERYSYEKVPMDEALVEVAIDVSGRPHLTFKVNYPKTPFTKLDPEVVKEFFEALVLNAGITMHIRLISGTNTHHIIECVFKAAAVALGRACALNPRKKGVPSTKGKL